MAGKCPFFNPRRGADIDLVGGRSDAEEMDHVNGSFPPDLSRALVFVATLRFAAPELPQHYRRRAVPARRVQNQLDKLVTEYRSLGQIQL